MKPTDAELEQILQLWNDRPWLHDESVNSLVDPRALAAYLTESGVRVNRGLTPAYVRMWGAYQALAVSYSDHTTRLERRIRELEAQLASERPRSARFPPQSESQRIAPNA